MSICEKIKTTKNKIKQNKAQYNLHRQTAKISDVSKYKFLTSKDVLREKDLLEKATIIKRFEYSLLSKELEKQTCLAKKKYQSFSKIFNHDEQEEPVTI